MIFENESAQVRIDLDHGARVASLRVEGLELLVTESADPLGWGAYPMAPWTGRLRQGRFEYQAQSFQLPLSLPPHAIHGTVHDQRWEEDGTHGARCELDGPWPFKGEVRQEFRLEEDALCLRLEVHARDEPFRQRRVGTHGLPVSWREESLLNFCSLRVPCALGMKKVFRRARR